ncbi:MAG TPA: efflux RND transporter periplasmic adaptor subunit [candidate division WOR-3 bacterium]|uniref:Efflux RND transporter periplasmic adaptor subunit n=1 Tax=candidate division WOR-3 bacterium TaxID=2052148 RepID=A0A9C9ENX7_UNCW3|nr:efflux RND transporter periplasmic adaptor subunit [candidate division WOR-3 bacterium]
MRKVFITLIIIAVLIIGFIIRIAVLKSGSRASEEVAEIAVEVVRVKRGDVKNTYELLGTINADKTAQVFPETMGRITRIYVKEGSYVAKNTHLMALRNETVGFNYEEGYIKAPISGNVARILVNVGSMVTPQTPVAMVVEFSTVKVVFNIAEDLIGSIFKGSRVEIRVDPFPDDVFSGKISEISPVIDPRTRTVAVKAVVKNSKKLLKPGMTARITITLDEKKDVIAVPRDALLDDYLFVVSNDKAERRDVKIGLVGDENVEIISGVKPGEAVIIVGQERLAGGESVAPIVRGE